MNGNENLLFIIPIGILILVVIYLFFLFIIRFKLKIKRDYTVESQVRKSLPIWFRYIYAILFIGAFVGYLFFHQSFGSFLVFLLLIVNQIITSTIALKTLEDKQQKYYHYSSVIFNSIAAFLMLAFVVAEII